MLNKKENVAIVMVGALIPDIVKIELIFDVFGVEVWDFIAPLHTLASSLLVAGLISMLFYESTVVFFTIGFRRYNPLYA